MQRANIIITILLAIGALIAWFFTAVVSWFPFIGTMQYPAMQIPLAITLSAAACFGWMLVWLSWRRGDHETRCRRCGHILRGLTEPRCPECGEGI